MSRISCMSRNNRTSHYEGVEMCTLSAAEKAETLPATHPAGIRFRPLGAGQVVAAVVITALAGAQWRPTR